MALMVAENLSMTWARPSRYQTGVVRYIGGHTNTGRSRRLRQKAKILLKNPGNTESNLSETDDTEAVLVMKFVTQAMTHTSASARTDSRVPERSDNLPQDSTWALDITGRSQMLVGDMWRRRFESPTIVKQESCAIMDGVEDGSKTRKMKKTFLFSIDDKYKNFDVLRLL